MRGIAFLLAPALLFVLLASSVAQEVVTNESVIQMVKAGLPEAVILAKIRSSQPQFDLKTDALIATLRSA